MPLLLGAHLSSVSIGYWRSSLQSGSRYGGDLCGALAGLRPGSNPLRASDRGFRPSPGAYDLVGSLSRWDPGQSFADAQNVRVVAVVADGFAVYLPDVCRPAIVVCVWQATCVASGVHTRSSPLSSRSPSTSAVRRTLRSS